MITMGRPIWPRIGTNSRQNGSKNIPILSTQCGDKFRMEFGWIRTTGAEKLGGIGTSLATRLDLVKLA
jgi:hypothetical protein